MSNDTVLGMQLEGGFIEDDGVISPLAALVVGKGLDGDGEEVYSVMCTKDMGPVEAGGLLKYAEKVVDVLLTHMLFGKDEEEDED